MWFHEIKFLDKNDPSSLSLLPLSLPTLSPSFPPSFTLSLSSPPSLPPSLSLSLSTWLTRDESHIFLLFLLNRLSRFDRIKEESVDVLIEWELLIVFYERINGRKLWITYIKMTSHGILEHTVIHELLVLTVYRNKERKRGRENGRR